MKYAIILIIVISGMLYSEDADYGEDCPWFTVQESKTPDVLLQGVGTGSVHYLGTDRITMYFALAVRDKWNVIGERIETIPYSTERIKIIKEQLVILYEEEKRIGESKAPITSPPKPRQFFRWYADNKARLTSGFE